MHLIRPHTCEYYHLHLNIVMNSFLKTCNFMVLRNSVLKPEIISKLLSLWANPDCMLAPAFLVRNVVLSLCTVGYSAKRKWKSLEKSGPNPKVGSSRRMLENSATLGQFVFDYTRVNMVAEVALNLLWSDWFYKLSVVDSCLNVVEYRLIVETIVFWQLWDLSAGH